MAQWLVHCIPVTDTELIPSGSRSSLFSLHPFSLNHPKKVSITITHARNVLPQCTKYLMCVLLRDICFWKSILHSKMYPLITKSWSKLHCCEHTELSKCVNLLSTFKSEKE